jgi:hypothetical protein
MWVRSAWLARGSDRPRRAQPQPRWWVIIVLAIALCGQSLAADRKASRCIYSDLSSTTYADGPCVLRDTPAAPGKLAAYTVSWPGGGASRANLRLGVVADKQGEGASQELTVDGVPAVGFEMTRGRYLIVTKDTRRALIIEGS